MVVLPVIVAFIIVAVNRLVFNIMVLNESRDQLYPDSSLCWKKEKCQVILSGDTFYFSDFHLQQINTEVPRCIEYEPCLPPVSLSFLSLPPTFPSLSSPLPIHHVDDSLGARQMFDEFFCTESSQPERAVFPSSMIFCSLISSKTSMKNSLFLFPQCNILIELDSNTEPCLSGSYEEFVTALISLYDRPWSVCFSLCF